MFAPDRRFLLALFAGVFFLPLLIDVSRRGPAANRTLETIGLFVLFVVLCLMLDRLRWLDRPVSGPVPSESAEAKRLGELRIGVPEGLVPLEALRRQRRLEQRLAPLGLSVVWRDYISASALLQALHANDIDFGGGGGTPSVFAQASDLLFVRVARDKYTHAGGEAVLVASDSPLHSLTDLRGHRVAVEEGSTAHYVLVRALHKAGLSPADVEIVFLSRSEALPQFRAGLVQAWSVWVPYAESPRRQHYPGRSIASLQELFAENDPTLHLPTLYYASLDLARHCPALLKLLLEEINEAGAQVNRDNLAVVERLRDQLRVSDDWLERLRALASERSIVPLDALSLSGLQRQADMLRDLRLIPRRVKVTDGTTSLMMRQNWTV
ncbi:MAG: ABC transporter substrate-binding protein [Cyanobacteriota bacterium]|nr:ABC transporter substrate-binding protein [Cyanobacteriota bacterium]